MAKRQPISKANISLPIPASENLLAITSSQPSAGSPHPTHSDPRSPPPLQNQLLSPQPNSNSGSHPGAYNVGHPGSQPSSPHHQQGQYQQNLQYNPPNHPAVVPFAAGRFDSSASIAGSPLDPRFLKAQREPPKLSTRDLQNFVQALGSYRRQIQAMAAASEAFVRALEDFAEFVEGADVKRVEVVGDLDFLIDSTHLVANSHQIWADCLERDFEEPIVQLANDIFNRAKNVQRENKQRVDDLTARLQNEENISYKLGKKKQRDLATLQNSLSLRVSISEEIKRLQVESSQIHDTLASRSVESILTNCAAGVRAELENYERIMEGLKKIGAFQTDEPPNNLQSFPPTTPPNQNSTDPLFTQPLPNLNLTYPASPLSSTTHPPSQPSRRSYLRYSFYNSPATEIHPQDSVSNVIPRQSTIGTGVKTELEKPAVVQQHQQQQQVLGGRMRGVGVPGPPPPPGGLVGRGIGGGVPPPPPPGPPPGRGVGLTHQQQQQRMYQQQQQQMYFQQQQQQRGNNNDGKIGGLVGAPPPNPKDQKSQDPVDDYDIEIVKNALMRL
ncbi:hypothetical protein HDV05_005087 [Chytridiales sp. JEL 0842]|nr:hypothetical protein HDV05_005087 [Chytridiales sp. JEL 0842]